jgi:RNA recognition motif-containing protein
VLRGVEPERQEELLRPLARTLGDELWRCWRDKDFAQGDSLLDRFEIALREAVAKLAGTELPAATVRIFVGNLAPTVDDAFLYDLFSPHGRVASAYVKTNRETGQSRGFGFVDMSDENQASAAISNLHGRNVDGESLQVNRVRVPRPRDIGPDGLEVENE